MGLHSSQSFHCVAVSVHTQLSKMSCPVSTPVNTFNKSKEDFIWFFKKAVQDKKSYSHSEMYHSLLKIFVDADTNRDGLVSKASFSKLVDAAASMPRAYGYAPADSDLYKTGEEKDAARQKMFDSMDLRLPPWILTQSLTKEVLKITRSSSQLLLTSLTVPRRLNSIGTCWRFSLNMTWRRLVLSS